MDALKEAVASISDQHAVVIAILVGVLFPLLLISLSKPKPIVNRAVDKGNKKVVHLVDVEDLVASDAAKENGNVVYCRCWRSKKFPYCDGAHVKHNAATGDNVGPLVVQCPNAKKE